LSRSVCPCREGGFSPSVFPAVDMKKK
jgi:hypothetical protein